MQNFCVPFSSATWFQHISPLRSPVEAEIMCIFVCMCVTVNVCLRCSWWSDKDFIPNRQANITLTDGISVCCTVFPAKCDSSTSHSVYFLLVVQTLFPLWKIKKLVWRISTLTCYRCHRPPLPSPSTRWGSRWFSETVFCWGLRLLRSSQRRAACRRGGGRDGGDGGGEEVSGERSYKGAANKRKLYFQGFREGILSDCVITQEIELHKQTTGLICSLS